MGVSPQQREDAKYLSRPKSEEFTQDIKMHQIADIYPWIESLERIANINSHDCK